MNAPDARAALRAALALLSFAKKNIRTLAPTAYPKGSVIELGGTIDKKPVTGHALILDWSGGQAVLAHPAFDHMLLADPENIRGLVRKATALEIKSARLFE